MEITLERAIKIASYDPTVLILKLRSSVLSIPYYSHAIPEIIGLSRGEFEGLLTENIFNAISAYDAEIVKRGLIKAIEADEPFNLNVQILNPKGGFLFFSGKCYYLGSDDFTTYYYCKLSDENQNNQLVNDENLEKDNQRQIKDLINFGNIFTWDWDLLNNKIYSNNLDNFNLDPSVLTNYPMDLINFGIIDTKDAANYIKNIEALKNGIDSIILENWYHLPNSKQPKYLKIQYIVEKDKNGHPVVAHGMGIDLSEVKNAEINFEHRTNAVMRMNPDSLASLQFNITENTVSNSSAAHASFSSLLSSKTVDDLIANFMPLIQDKSERLYFINAFSRGSLLASFNSGIFQLKQELHMVMKNNHEEWVRTTVDIDKNPLTGDVEAVMHIINIHHRKVIDSMISGTIQREFDFIALAYIKTNSYVLIDRYNQSMQEENTNFIEDFKNIFRNLIQSQTEYEKLIQEFNVNNLLEKINMFGEYTIQFNSNDDIEKNHHRILRFSFLNNRRDIISISCRDTTKLYNEELEQKKRLSNAVYEAEKANRAKSDFLSLVSHDIRTPLNGIMGMTQLALKEDNMDKIRKYLQKAEMSSSFLLGLINDLLDMSKIESGKVELHPEIYSYKEFSEYINSVIRPLCQKKNLRFTVHSNEMVNYLMVDKLRFNQIMFNILSNSCKYTNEGGSVQLKMACEKVNESLCICTFVVKDNGIGMTEEFQEHLFETFSQENRMSFDHNEGTGLGLSITHSLIELMGGEITVDSEINKGTTFTVQLTLPYFDEIDDEKIESSKSANKKIVKKDINDYTGCNFLLCEDNIINQEIANEILTNLGANVIIADDGEIGVNKYNQSDPDYFTAIFMDIRMPNLDGLSASKKIRALDRKDAKKIPIIAMTANAMSEDKMECIEAGMNAFIAKPINVKDLYKIMESVIQ